MKASVLGSITVCSLFVVSLASAGPARGVRKEVPKRAQATLDDQYDARHLSRVIHGWRQAVARADRRAERRADRALQDWLRHEIREEREEDRVAQRQRIRSERNYRRATRSGPLSQQERYRRREAKHHRYDEHAERRETRQTIIIARRLVQLQPLFSAGRASKADYQEKRRLLEELRRIEMEEVRRSRQVLREDPADRRSRYRKTAAMAFKDGDVAAQFRAMMPSG